MHICVCVLGDGWVHRGDDDAHDFEMNVACLNFEVVVKIISLCSTYTNLDEIVRIVYRYISRYIGAYIYVQSGT